MILHSLREEHGVEPPQRFYLDFESAAMKAVRKIYPESSIIGCDTHFKRTIRKNLQKKGLLKTYNQDSSLQSFVRSLWALSLVPVDDVLSVWENFIKKNIPDSPEEEGNKRMEEFVSYFEYCWVGAIHPRTGSRRKPLYRHDTWNKYDAVLHQQDTTTNRYCIVT